MESKIWYKWTYLTKQKQTHRHREQTCGCQGGGWWGGMDWEFGISRCKLLYIGWINSKVLLYSTGNYVQYPVINHSRKEYKKLNHFAVLQKLTQHCKSTILQLKKLKTIKCYGDKKNMKYFLNLFHHGYLLSKEYIVVQLFSKTHFGKHSNKNYSI